MLRDSAARLLVPVVRNTLQKRCQSVVSGPPTEHITTGDKIFLGGGMIACILAVPTWVLVHIREYRGIK